MKLLVWLPSIVMLSTAMSIGCSSNQTKAGTDVSSAGAAHEHPKEGPHQGVLVELGKEQFHAEVVHDHDLLQVYILDRNAKSPVAIDAGSATVNLMREGKPLQFKLNAMPQSSDPANLSSRFESADKDLMELLDDENANAKLKVTVEGKSYQGSMVHHHEHS